VGWLGAATADGGAGGVTLTCQRGVGCGDGCGDGCAKLVPPKVTRESRLTNAERPRTCEKDRFMVADHRVFPPPGKSLVTPPVCRRPPADDKDGEGVVKSPLDRFRIHTLPDVLAYVAERGGDPAALLARCGLPADAGERLFIETDISRLSQLLDCAAQAASDPALGLSVGLRLQRRTWDVLQLACTNAPTLGDAVLRIPRLMPLLNSAVEIEVDPGPKWRINHRIAGHPSGLSRHGNELWLATLLTRARQETRSRIEPLRCWFGHPAPADLAPLRAVFGAARLDFGAGSTGLSLSAEVMARPLLRADPVVSAVLERLSAEALQAQGGRRGLSAEVYRRIRDELDGTIPKMGRIAKLLGQSERSLQRSLCDEGTSYRELVDQVRRDLAAKWLAEGLARDEVARRLAYAETASFTRSLLRWRREPSSR
jgi:AraC-like DNA-binding protein